jgi:predicted phosphodiesterase
MRYLVFGDVHGNAPALEAVLQDAARQGYDEIVFLGDLIGYYPYPIEVVDRLRSLAPRAHLAGNHDLLLVQLAEGADAAQTKEASVVVEVVERHLALLDADAVRFLSAAVETVVDEVWSATHGGFRARFEYLSGLTSVSANLAHLSTPLGLTGHTHVPRAFAMVEADGAPLWRNVEFVGPEASYLVPPRARAFLNPGSVGQPRDGDPAAAYALFEPDSRRFTVRRVAYDVGGVQRRVRQEGYPAALGERLARGR